MRGIRLAMVVASISTIAGFTGGVSRPASSGRIATDGCPTQPLPGPGTSYPTFYKDDVSDAAKVLIAEIRSWGNTLPTSYGPTFVLTNSAKSKFRTALFVCELTKADFDAGAGRMVGIVRSDRSVPGVGIYGVITYIWLDRRRDGNTAWRFVMIDSATGSRHVVPVERLESGTWPSTCENLFICWELKTSAQYDRILVSAIRGGYFATP